MRAGVLAGAVAGALAAGAPGARAQTLASGPYERARLLVEGGRGAEGRRLADSLVAASPEGSPALAEALWWRAALAADARDSEHDLRRLTTEIPASPRAGAATVRLAQLALLREQPEAAAALLAPLARPAAPDAPGDPARPLAAYWLARARLAQRDPVRACQALADVGAAGAELDAQVAALRLRLPGCPTPGEALAAGASPNASPSAAAAGSAGASPNVASHVAPPGAAPAAAPGAPASAPTTRPPNAAPPVAPRTVAPAAPFVAPPAAAPAAPAYAVQVAAYDAPGGAVALAARLRASGLDAASEGQGPAGAAAPFRVKVGRYATRAAAAAALRDLRRRGLAGFVTAAPRAAVGSAPEAP